MKKPFNTERKLLILIDFILPLPLTLLMFWLWYLRTHNLWFAAFPLALGLMFGYVIPGIGTNLLGLWRFKWPLRMGNYFIHHGFIYAPYFALTLFACFGSWEQLNLIQVVTIIITTGLIQGLISPLHDIAGIKAEMIEIYNQQNRDQKSAEEIVLAHGPLGFALIGAAYAGCCLLAYYFFVLKHATDPWLFLGLVAAGTCAMGLTSIPYIITHRAFIGAAKKSGKPSTSAASPH